MEAATVVRPRSGLHRPVRARPMLTSHLTTTINCRQHQAATTMLQVQRVVVVARRTLKKSSIIRLVAIIDRQVHHRHRHRIIELPCLATTNSSSQVPATRRQVPCRAMSCHRRVVSIITRQLRIRVVTTTIIRVARRPNSKRRTAAATAATTDQRTARRRVKKATSRRRQTKSKTEIKYYNLKFDLKFRE